MWRFRTLLSVTSPLRTPAVVAQPRVYSSNGPQQMDGTFYEFRTYRIQPHLNSAFLKLTDEKIHLRTAHSKLLGYWSVEYGGLNQVIHIWKYDSFSQRASVRAALAKDPCWISEYLSVAIPMLTSQDNEVTYLLPWSRLQMPPQEGGVYELVSFQMRSGDSAVWGDSLRSMVTSRDAAGYGKLLGVFHSDVGLQSRVHTLWWFESADHRANLHHSFLLDPSVKAAVKDCVVHLGVQKNKLMFPCSFSPLK
ncbi:protein NipSnap homolog 3A [Synchiropus splendidus]|uniref:protein NipSnap homolog 3A n=1 Tax=Synchiropus splendidus TaxID=270530 RepID=UPI00237E3DA2|nr:protein NipSnap homolog 3A [Synchiropus splendidus]